MRGRPRKHFATDTASAASVRKAAYRARLAVKRDRNLRRALQRDIARLRRVQKITLIEVKLTNKILSALGLGMTRGEFLSDAPTGAGLLVSGGYLGEKISLIQAKRDAAVVELGDGRLAPLFCGRRVAPKGASGDEEDVATSRETETTFTDKQAFPLEWEECEEQKQLRSTVIEISLPTCWCGSRAVAVQQSRIICEKHALARVA